jgi:hypothetical protein
MKTLVYIMFNGAASDHVFDVEVSDFKLMWESQIISNGYFEGVDRNGTRVFINPSQCPVIEISEWKH